MAFLPDIKTPDEVKKLTMSKVKAEYNKIAAVYAKIIEREIIFCDKCGEPFSKYNFYTDKRCAMGYRPICKECVQKVVEQRVKPRDEPNITKESFKEGLKLLDRPYIKKLYDDCMNNSGVDTGERSKRSVFSSYMTQLLTLPQHRNDRIKCYADSDRDDDDDDGAFTSQVNENSRFVKTGRKRFGEEQSPAQLYFLEYHYEDFLSRYEVNLKSQEVLIQEVVYKMLELKEARLQHKETSKLDKDLQDLMGSLNMKPSQNNSELFNDAKTFGQMIDEQEKEKPIPEPEGVFKDIDHIAMLVDGFFRGHLVKMMGIKNAWSQFYDRIMEKYTVKKSSDVEEDDEDIFNDYFGNELNKELENYG